MVSLGIKGKINLFKYIITKKGWQLTSELPTFFELLTFISLQKFDLINPSHF